MTKATRTGNIIGTITLALAAVGMVVVGVAAERPFFFMSALPLVIAGVVMATTHRGAGRKATARTAAQL